MNSKRIGFVLSGGCIVVGLAAVAPFLVARIGSGRLGVAAAPQGSFSAFAHQSKSGRGPWRSSRLEYGCAIRADLFSARVAGSGLLARMESVAGKVVLPADIAASPADPLADYVFVGSVTVDGVTTALLEHRGTHEGWYVAAGDEWQNYRIESVGPDAVALSVNGRQSTLAKSDTFSAVPLVADATGFTRTPSEDADGTGSGNGSSAAALLAIAARSDDLVVLNNELGAASVSIGDMQSSIDYDMDILTVDKQSMENSAPAPPTPYDGMDIYF